MKTTIAQAYLASHGIEDFFECVRAMNGDFELGVAEMTALGEAFKKRNGAWTVDAAQQEYRAVRCCIVERVLAGFRVPSRPLLSSLLHHPEKAEILLTNLLRQGIVSEDDLLALERGLNRIRSEIDLLPKGLIRERFSAGITPLFNVLYLLARRLREN